jgi:toxin ParE1/3/4
MPSRHEIIWTPRASEDLIRLLEYMDRQSVTGANRFRAECDSMLDRISELPHIGTLYLRRPGIEVREVFVSPYRIFYHEMPELTAIEILRLLHAKRKDPKFGRRRKR